MKGLTVRVHRVWQRLGEVREVGGPGVPIDEEDVVRVDRSDVLLASVVPRDHSGVLRVGRLVQNVVAGDPVSYQSNQKTRRRGGSATRDLVLAQGGGRATDQVFPLYRRAISFHRLHARV